LLFFFYLFRFDSINLNIQMNDILHIYPPLTQESKPRLSQKHAYLASHINKTFFLFFCRSFPNKPLLPPPPHLLTITNPPPSPKQSQEPRIINRRPLATHNHPSYSPQFLIRRLETLCQRILHIFV